MNRKSREHSDQPHVGEPSSEKLMTVNLNYSSQKRRRESEDCETSAKKLCLLRANSIEAETANPAVDTKLSTSLVSQPSWRHFSVFELSPEPTNGQLCTESACGQSTCLDSSFTLKPTQSSPTSLSSKPCLKRQLSTEANDKRNKSSTVLPSEVPQKPSGNSPHVQLSGHLSGHAKHNTRVLDLPVKNLSKVKQMEETRKTDFSTHKPLSKSNSGSVSTVTSSLDPEHIESPFSSTYHSQILSPTVSLMRLKFKNTVSLCSKDPVLKKSPITSSGRKRKLESVKTDEKHKSLPASNVTPCASKQTSASPCCQTPPLERQASEGDRKQMTNVNSIDVELDLGLSLALDLDLSQSSHSSEEEQLFSLQEMINSVSKPPDTSEKGAFSETSTPGHHSCHSKAQPLLSTSKKGTYKNNLDQMLKEIHTQKKTKENENDILTACEKELLTIAEYNEVVENQEEGISSEQQEFLQRFSLTSSAIREVPPGEVVFNLEKFGRIFNQDTLQLSRCTVIAQSRAQKTLLRSSPAQLRSHVIMGSFQEAYGCRSPCPTQVTRFLFKMMSVHTEWMVTEKILQALCDIASTAAYQIDGSQQFEVWVPSLAEVTLVLMNMGVAFVILFPFENLQPSFTEGDLLKDLYIKSESPSSNKEQNTFPLHNFNNLLKYLSYCMGLCPRAYSDDELLLFLTVVGRVGLETRLILQSSVELNTLQYKIVNNIRDWDTMLHRICLALTDLTEDHHNMCLLVQLLPDSTRGKQLRQHLSLSMISKLFDATCKYRPTEKEFQLAELRPYLPLMRPSSLRCLLKSCSRIEKDKEDYIAILDQQSYYLCYSLLTLANEASHFQFFPAHQKEQLLILCSELETHIKCDIRESVKCLYRSKVKDLVARIYIKWQMLLQQTRPLHCKLYDYWQPSSMDALTCSQVKEEIPSSDGGEGSVIEEHPVMEVDEEEEEEETNAVEENEVVPTAEEQEMELGDTKDDTNKTK